MSSVKTRRPGRAGTMLSPATCEESGPRFALRAIDGSCHSFRNAMQLDQTLVDAALALAAARWPGREAGAAALYTSSGRILTSVSPESPNQSASLCHETGAICEAHKLQES